MPAPSPADLPKQPLIRHACKTGGGPVDRYIGSPSTISGWFTCLAQLATIHSAGKGRPVRVLNKLGRSATGMTLYQRNKELCRQHLGPSNNPYVTVHSVMWIRCQLCIFIGDPEAEVIQDVGTGVLVTNRGSHTAHRQTHTTKYLEFP